MTWTKQDKAMRDAMQRAAEKNTRGTVYVTDEDAHSLLFELHKEGLTLAATPSPAIPEAGLDRLREAMAKLPPGPYRAEGPFEQGGPALLWGREGTPPDFTDGWAIPLVARGVDTAIYALAELLNALIERLRAEPAEKGAG